MSQQKTHDAVALVMNRFFLRLVLLIVFAGFGMLRGQEFTSTLRALCILAGGFCIGLAVLYREPIRARSPTNWHEATGFVAFALVTFLLG